MEVDSKGMEGYGPDGKAERACGIQMSDVL